MLVRTRRRTTFKSLAVAIAMPWPSLLSAAAGLARAAAQRWLEGKEIVKTVHVPDRMVSFVVKG